MTTPRAPDGYRRDPLTAGGPRLRADVVDVYLFRTPHGAGRVEFLQLLRNKDPLGDTWQPVMGHVEAGETAVAAALRELHEEVGIDPSRHLAGFWALEQVWPFYIAAIDCVVLSPRFAAQVAPGWEPLLNHEHRAARWVSTPVNPDHPDLRAILDQHFMWPGQRHTIVELLREVVTPGSLSRQRLQIAVPAPGGGSTL